MTYNRKQRPYGKGKGTSRRRSSFAGSMLKVLLPFVLLLGVGVFVATNLGLESFLFTQNKIEINENIVGEIEEEEIVEVEEEIEIAEEVEFEDEVFTIVQEMPRFPGCEDLDVSIDEKKRCAEKKMLGYIYANIKYPSIDADTGFEGMTVVSFVVNKEGGITNPKLLRGGGALGEEYIRIVKSMPQWIPGKQRGEPVNVEFNLPLRIKPER